MQLYLHDAGFFIYFNMGNRYNIVEKVINSYFYFPFTLIIIPLEKTSPFMRCGITWKYPSGDSKTNQAIAGRPNRSRDGGNNPVERFMAVARWPRGAG